MAQRPLLPSSRWDSLLGVPTDEVSLIRHYTLGRAELDLIHTKIAAHNELGLAVQLCLMRHPGRAWRHAEVLPASFVAFVAEQIAVPSNALADYMQRDTTRREHASEAQRYLGLHPADRQDRRAALNAAIAAAASTDKGQPIAGAIVAAFADRRALLPAADTLDRIGRAGRAVARKHMEVALLDGVTSEGLARLDGLLVVDPSVRLTRFAWLRALPETTSEKNLLALLNRLNFVRSLGLDPKRRARIHPDRWDQLVREGAVTPSWLAEDFSASRRQSLIAAQLIELTSKLTDAAITMFCRLMARLFTKTKNRQEQRHLDARQETARLLRMFGDTLRALTTAKESGEDALKVLNREIGWDQLVKAQTDVEALIVTAEAEPLLGAAERYSWVRRYAPEFIEAFAFRSAQVQDLLLKAIEFLQQLNRDDRHGLPPKAPLTHLTRKARKLIAAHDNRKRHLWEIATLAGLRDGLRSGDIWVEGGRTYCRLEDQLMPSPAFSARKEAGDLRLGIPNEADVWIAEKQRELDFKLKKLNYQARTGKLVGVRLVNGVLTIAKQRTKVPKSKVDAAKWLILERMPQIDITDLLAEVNTWTNFAQSFTHLRTGDEVRHTPALLAAILGDGTNLGAKRMADASAGLTERQITWARLFHIRPETYRSALAAVIDVHLTHPFAKL